MQQCKLATAHAKSVLDDSLLFSMELLISPNRIAKLIIDSVRKQQQL